MELHYGPSVVSINSSVSCSAEEVEGTVMLLVVAVSGMSTEGFLDLLGLCKPVSAKSASVCSISACDIKNRFNRV